MASLETEIDSWLPMSRLDRLELVSLDGSPQVGLQLKQRIA